jgi:hypothetical protein
MGSVQTLLRGTLSAILEPFPSRLNRNGALAFCFDAFSLREPESTSLENALDGMTVNACSENAQRFKPPGTNYPVEEMDVHGCLRKGRLRRATGL